MLEGSTHAAKRARQQRKGGRGTGVARKKAGAWRAPHASPPPGPTLRRVSSHSSRPVPLPQRPSVASTPSSRAARAPGWERTWSRWATARPRLSKTAFSRK